MTEIKETDGSHGTCGPDLSDTMTSWPWVDFILRQKNTVLPNLLQEIQYIPCGNSERQCTPLASFTEILEGAGHTRCSGAGTHAIVETSVLPGSEPIPWTLGCFDVRFVTWAASLYSTLGWVCEISAWVEWKTPERFPWRQSLQGRGWGWLESCFNCPRGTLPASPFSINVYYLK